MKYFLMLMVTLLLLSCESNTNTFTLQGSAQGFEDGYTILVYQLNPESNQPSVIDTLTVTNGTFSGTYEQSDLNTVNYLSFDNKGNIAYFPENEDLRVTVYKDSINSSFVSGSPQNDAYTDFTEAIRGFAAQKQANAQRYKTAVQQQDNMLVAQIRQENTDLVSRELIYKQKFIAEHPNALFSAMLISEMLNRQELSASEAKNTIEGLSPKLQASPVVVKIKATVDKMGATNIGGKAPNFSAMTPEGKELALNDVLGKYTIIDFWASWCKPCRRENPNVVDVYEKYHDKGLNIISVSLDRQGQKSRWVQAIEDDNMDWYHVSNLQFWNDPIAKNYNVRSIPATFLLDENGVIIDKNLRGPALGRRIGELLD